MARQGAYRPGGDRSRFVFAITMAERDRALLARFQRVLGVGSLTVRKPQRPSHQPCWTLTVGSFRSHLAVTVPFMDRYLLPCAKRRQYEAWRLELCAYLDRHPLRWGQGRSVCAIEGCDGTVRGRGLCRRHYYVVTGY